MDDKIDPNSKSGADNVDGKDVTDNSNISGDMDKSNNETTNPSTESVTGLSSEPGSTSVNSLKPNKKSKFPKIDFKNMNKNTKLALILVSVLLVVGIITFLLMRNNSEPVSNNDNYVAQEESTKKSLGASITLQEGTLQMQENGDWKDITSEQTIGEGSILRTVGATSRAVITFDDGSALRLDANSEAELSELTTEKILIKHVSGYTYNRVLPSDNLKYVVTSNDTQYEAKGTAFITVSTGDEQAVEVYHSSVQETSTNKIPNAGEKLTVQNKANPSEDGKISKLDIEEVKNDPFVQWNVELDKKDENFKNSLGFLSDTTAPEITLNSKDGDVVLLDPSATQGTIEISGSTESGAKVTVLSKSQSGAVPVDVTVGSDGKFTTPVLSAPIGDSVFEFVAKDKTGNKTTKSVRIKFQKKSQPVAGNATGFVLTSEKNTEKGKVILNWKLNGVESPDGVKVVYSTTKSGGDLQYKSDGVTGVKSDLIKTGTSWSSLFGDLAYGNGTYYFKACIYDKASGTCGLYSNQETVVVP